MSETPTYKESKKWIVFDWMDSSFKAFETKEEAFNFYKEEIEEHKDSDLDISLMHIVKTYNNID